MSTNLLDLSTAEGAVPDYMRMVTMAMTNSTAMQRVAIKHVEDLLAGKAFITDTVNPFTTLMGVNAENCAALTLGAVANLRKRYPTLATNMTMLYPHMNDEAYIGRFALPHKQKIRFICSVDEMRSKMVLDVDGSRQMRIPRYSSVSVDGVTFTLMYPVVVRERSYGGWSAHYDLSNVNELHPLTSSSLYPVINERTNGGSIFGLEVEMLQVLAASTSFDVNPSVGINRKIELQDQFCYARVWFKGRTAANWTEMHTTHEEMVHDALEPTAVLSVADGTLQVRVPQVYLTTNLVSGKVRVDVYTTKGEIFLNTTEMRIDNFTSEFRGSTQDTLTTEESAFLSIVNKYYFFSGIASGGRAEMSFTQVRDRLIMNTLGVNQQPITPAQLTQALEDSNYTIQRFVDNITTRDLLASRPLPASKDPQLITPGSATMESVLTSVGELKTSPWVADNGSRITIAPSALWKMQNGVVVLASATELTELMAMDAETRVLNINNRGYLFSPFYYVVDTSTDLLAVRPYYLDNPAAIVNKFLGENDTTGMSIEVNTLKLVNTGNGWQLIVSTTSNQTWKDQDDVYKIAQLNYVPPGVGSAAAINSEYLGTDETGEDMFSFSLPSGYDIDDGNKLSMLGFHALTNDPREVFCDLRQDFRLIFITGSQLSASSRPSTMDSQIVTVNMPLRFRAVQGQQVQLQFGSYLKNLWSACRTLAPSTPWRTYDADEPATWPANEYEPNPDNGTDLWFNADGSVYTKLLHAQGSLMVIDGVQIYNHRKGQIIFQGGQPVPVDASTLQRQFSMLFLEGSYYFATDASTVEYTDEMVKVLEDYIVNGLEGFQLRTSERTRVFFYPKVTLGNVSALVDGNTIAEIKADQELVIRLGVAPRVFDNEKMRDDLEAKTVQVIYNFFSREVVSISDLLDELRKVYSSDVISVVVTGLGGETEANAITLINANERLSIKKRVVILESGEFTVREAAAVDFFNHGATAL